MITTLVLFICINFSGAGPSEWGCARWVRLHPYFWSEYLLFFFACQPSEHQTCLEVRTFFCTPFTKCFLWVCSLLSKIAVVVFIESTSSARQLKTVALSNSAYTVNSA